MLVISALFLPALAGSATLGAQALEKPSDFYLAAIEEAISQVPRGEIVLDFSPARTFQTPEQAAVAAIADRLRVHDSAMGRSFLLDSLEARIRCEQTENRFARRCYFTGDPVAAVVSVSAMKEKGDEALVSVRVTGLPVQGRELASKIATVHFKKSQTGWALSHVEWTVF
jgi:hypothetical protein